MFKMLGSTTVAVLLLLTLRVNAEDKVGTPDPAPTPAPAVQPAPSSPDEADIEYGPKDDDDEGGVAAEAKRESFMQQPLTAAELKTLDGAPVWKPFMKAFKKCNPDCEPRGVKTFFKTGRPKSCLLTGHSLNIAAIACGKDKKVSMAINGGEFEKMIKCVSRAKGLHTAYKTSKDKVRGFRQFALVSVGCNGNQY